MTHEAKVAMYSEKKKFIDNLNLVFQTNPKGSTISEITYEVYMKPVSEENNHYLEWIIVTYHDGYKAVIRASGNSNMANFIAISRVLFSDDYSEELSYYESLLTNGWGLLSLPSSRLIDNVIHF